MLDTPYPKEPMHRFKYTKLTESQILAALAPAAAAGPTSASPLSDAFSGKSIRIVTDKGGPTLAYRFTGNKQLTVAENGGRAVKAGYGALVQDHIAFFVHLIPGTQRGYAVVIDQHTNLASVFELWFSGYEDKREVMREIYHGYVEQPGKEASKARHVPTNRVEGKAYHWTQDNGIETLEFYPSASYSHFVELTRLGGELGYCGPSDYVRINEEFYIYTRTECEFSGVFTLYVLDANRSEQVGVRLGFDARDQLEYYVFRGKGEWLGQLATFEKFGDVSGNPVPVPPPGGKGQRRVYRPLQTMTKLTREQTDEAAKKTKVMEKRSSMAGNGSDSTDALAGKALTLRYDDGPAIEYRFDAAEELRWRFEGKGEWTKTRYKAFESMPGVYLFGHLLEGTPHHDGHVVVLDFDHGLTTCINPYVNTPYIANEANARTYFGVIEMDGIIPPQRRRHERTDELLGRALTWNYSPGLTSMHLYSTPHTVSWIIFTESGHGGSQWSGPGEFVKIRENLFFLYWSEEACNGSVGSILVNMRTMHDVGIGYHCDDKGLSMGEVGAHSRHAGRYDIKRFFERKG